MTAKRALLVGLLLLSGAGCKNVYAPNIATTPLLKKQGELRATADLRNAQVAYGLFDRVGLLLNGYFRSHDRTTEDDGGGGGGERQEGSGWLVEAGAGWFTTLREPDWLQVEVYGGVGNGRVEHTITPAGGMPRSFEAEGFKLFVMPSIGMSSRWLDVGVSTRLVAVAYGGTRAEGYTGEQLAADGFAGLEDHAWWFFEPSLTIRAGYEWAKLQLQIGRSFKINSDELAYDRGMVTLALHVDLFRY